MSLGSDSVFIEWSVLREFMKRIFCAIGMPKEDAGIESDALIWANLRGVDTHGVVRVPGYVENVDLGYMKPKPNVSVISETAATAMIEADRAFGPVVTVRAADMAMAKAETVGIGWVLIKNTMHQGAIGQYAEMIAKRDMIGVAVTTSAPIMVPFGGRTAGLGNNPLAICVPAARYSHVLLDMATSLVAYGRILVAQESGLSIPEGWGLDKDGKPTTDPWQIAALLPMAGPKGSGLALVLECLGSILAANALVQPVLTGGPNSQKLAPSQYAQNSFVMAVNIASFTDVSGYKTAVDELVDSLKALPTAEGFREILMPGEVEERRCADRVANGIPVPPRTVTALKEIAGRLRLELPEVLR